MSSHKLSRKRLTTWQKATALVPLALLSGAWTTSLAVTSSASASTDDTTTLPDGTTVPNKALDAPASVSQPGSIAPGVPKGASDSIIANSSANGIPAAALAAYQRAQEVINSADKSCNLQWQLIAAIGRVESDHGRYGGNVLGKDGVSRPGIYGIPLDGSNGTAAVSDTDGGQFDNDPVYDRAVGPMQFIPSTWRVVGVDGDGDGKRNPQDIDDASLATAVYLCSGQEDLSTSAGQKAAVYRYNHSKDYVDLVLAIMNAYLKGDFTSVPNGSTSAPVFSPSYGDAVVMPATVGDHRARSHAAGGHRSSGHKSGSRPTAGSGGGGTTPSAPQAPSGSDPVTSTTSTAKSTVDKTTDTVKKTTDSTTSSTTNTLTKAEATQQCLDSGISALDTAALTDCVNKLMN